MPALILTVIACLFLLGSNPLIGQAVVYGKVENQLFNLDHSSNAYLPNAIKVYPDNLLNNDDLVQVTLDEQGYYRFNLPVRQPLPVMMEFNGKTLQLFISPGDMLLLNFDYSDIVQSAQANGTGALSNDLLIAFQQRYSPEDTDNEARSKRQYTTRQDYFAFCEDRNILEREFVLNGLSKQTYPPEFVNWILAEVKYRKANRLSAYYFTTEDPLIDDYHRFAASYNFNDTTAIVSNQYLLFLENHLRHLSKRDDISARSARQASGIPWVVRGYELVKLHFTGLYRQLLLTRMMMDIANEKCAETPAIYADFLQEPITDGLRNLAGARYATYTAAIENLHLPPDAQLTVLPPNEQTTLQNILNPFWGKVVYIDFWATWCAPCLQEMEHSVALQQMYKGEEVVFLYLSLDQSADKWRTKIAELGVDGYHYLLNSALTTEAAKLWQLGAIPRYMLVNKQGIVVNPNAPNPTNNQLIVQLDNLLNK